MVSLDFAAVPTFTRSARVHGRTRTQIGYSLVIIEPSSATAAILIGLGFWLRGRNPRSSSPFQLASIRPDTPLLSPLGRLDCSPLAPGTFLDPFPCPPAVPSPSNRARAICYSSTVLGLLVFTVNRALCNCPGQRACEHRGTGPEKGGPTIMCS